MEYGRGEELDKIGNQRSESEESCRAESCTAVSDALKNLNNFIFHIIVVLFPLFRF